VATKIDHYEVFRAGSLKRKLNFDPCSASSAIIGMLDVHRFIFLHKFFSRHSVIAELAYRDQFNSFSGAGAGTTS